MFRTAVILLCFTLALACNGQTAFAGGEAPAKKNSASEIKGDVVAAREAWKWINRGALLIDVRSVDEYKSGHIEGSLNIVHTETAALSKAIGPEPERPVVVYCRSGSRSGRAQKALEGLGYTAIFHATGYDALEATRP